MNLYELLDRDLLTRRLADGYVRRQTHPDAPLAILNYSEKAQYEWEWDDVTEQCRGLIYDTETERIVARPWRKFHNWDQSGTRYPPTGPMLISPKFDGSLGILYPHPDGTLRIATRGSFTSEQALHATRRLGEYIKELDDALGEHWYGQFLWDTLVEQDRTALFEIIYPENRIVVDYGQEDKLVLLDVLDNATGRPEITLVDQLDWPHVAERKVHPGFEVTLAADIPEGEEGFVLYWPHHDHRVKVKSAEYVALHRIVTGLNERTVWSAFGPDGRGTSLQRFCEPLPDEFHPWVADVVERLTTELYRILTEVADLYKSIELDLAIEYGHGEWTRRHFALKASKTQHAAYLFLMLDKRHDRLKEKIWDSLKPVGAVYAKQLSEDVA